ncbi:hypothetical protein ABFS82_10G020200 [Erythranthe guttata]|uniref:F-box/LRR-repeat protein At3g26922-like n=1 Tax=Erythranthe guttata TaxID=4155 RepID=UPI00064DAD9B|nr:PREDICTED: F-box/LRR-repeat protein At3g26922-like [Erythranthe guttata]|eukprot:XP_012832133.1 PREDICTED: F-box/LRR-repeat protein At3g26922-like [Erythranthe guttata]
MVGKGVTIDWKLRPKKCGKRCYVDNDRISQLPDAILVTILSFLSMKEAARTSVLSSRWINLWKDFPRLDFDAESALLKIARDYELHGEESGKYVEWVNRVIQSHKATTLKEFRVCFDLSRSVKNSITQWLEFALSRHVEKLELDFKTKFENSGCEDTHYNFPEKFLKHPSQSSSINFKSLKALSLKCVNVTGEAIEFFLRNCPSLEKLVVTYTSKLSNLEVCGPSLALKHLDLRFCFRLKSVKVSAPNLISLTVPKVEGLLLENVPALVELSLILTIPYRAVKKKLSTLSCCISQLEILYLNLDSKVKDIDLPTLPKLKKLAIRYWISGDKSLFGLTPFIRASPNLKEFVLQLCCCDSTRSDGQVKNTVKFPHEHLKVFKFCGYYGRSSDVELVWCILENCVALEKLIIDPSYPPTTRSHRPLRPERLVEERISRVYAKQQLESQVPQHIELVIL